jgi:hypothetical protein
MLRTLARTVSPHPDDPDAPKDSTAAEERLKALLARLRAETRRMGLASATSAFVDHLAQLSERYGPHLFVCFDHPKIPPTTNDLERFFGASKGQLRRTLGTKSTAGGVAQNLGADYLKAFATTWCSSTEQLIEALRNASPDDYRQARTEIDLAEAPARLRRSRRRFPEDHIQAICAAWERGLDK